MSPVLAFTVSTLCGNRPSPSYSDETFGRCDDFAPKHCFDQVFGAVPEDFERKIYAEGVSGKRRYHELLHYVSIQRAANKKFNNPITQAANRKNPRRPVT